MAIDALRAPAAASAKAELLFDVIAMGPTATAGDSRGAHGGGSSGNSQRPATRRSPVPITGGAWNDVEISREQAGGGEAGVDDGHGGGGDGHGNGGGHDAGAGGIGFGTGGGISAAQRVPDPPRVVEPPPSRARPAKLIYPVRDRDVDDEGNLFIARITVDTNGDVVGAHMVKTRPGVTGDQASSAIWTFRYLPALDDRGTPIRSTFDQPFQIR